MSIGGCYQNGFSVPQSPKQSMEDHGICYVGDEELVEAEYVGVGDDIVCHEHKGIRGGLMAAKCGVDVQHEIMKMDSFYLRYSDSTYYFCYDNAS